MVAPLKGVRRPSRNAVLAERPLLWGGTSPGSDAYCVFLQPCCNLGCSSSLVVYKGGFEVWLNGLPEPVRKSIAFPAHG